MSLLPDTRHSLLIRLAEPADLESWHQFEATYQEAIYRYSRSHGLQDADARDVVQHVLLAVHQVIGDWKPSGRAGSFRRWLLETAHRASLKALRERSHCDRAQGGTSVIRRLREVPDSAASATDETSDWQRWAFCWAAGQVRCEVHTATWQAFCLTAVEGLPTLEVAARLGVKPGSVYASKCRVLARIRDRVFELSRSEP